MSLEAFLGRTFADILSGGTLGVAIETRNIVVAQGIQFTNADMMTDEPYGALPNGLVAPLADRTKWPRSMKTRAPLTGVTSTSSGFTFTNVAQGVKYVVQIVTSKQEFRKALLTPNTHVIYDGHARFGRGPCFGILPKPGVLSKTEDWENGTSATTGIFRMGYPFIGIPISEILEHGYTADPVAPSIKVKPEDCDPDTRPFAEFLVAKTALSMDKALLAQLKDKDPKKTWLAFRAPDEGQIVWYLLLNAGWTGTVSAPADLGATTPTCHVFCHFGCSSFRHNQKILRSTSFKGWQKTGDDKLAYFTTNLSYTGTTTYWLYHLFTYPTKNAFLDWEPSLTYALNNTNADLKRDRVSYRII